jgi:hypothetical protein
LCICDIRYVSKINEDKAMKDANIQRILLEDKCTVSWSTFSTLVDGDSDKVHACTVLLRAYGVNLWGMRSAGATQYNNLCALKHLTFGVNKVTTKNMSSHNINDVEM